MGLSSTWKVEGRSVYERLLLFSPTVEVIACMSEVGGSVADGPVGIKGQQSTALLNSIFRRVLYI